MRYPLTSRNITGLFGEELKKKKGKKKKKRRKKGPLCVAVVEVGEAAPSVENLSNGERASSATGQSEHQKPHYALRGNVGK